MSEVPVLIVFAGRPGTGKTTIAKALGLACGALYLRVDTVEQAMRSAGVAEVGAAGYAVLTAVAEENLALGRDVIADSVNPVAASREAFAACARAAGARLIEVELVCMNVVEHRRRIEHRASDIPGLVPPDWAAVMDRHYEPFDGPRIVIDTARVTPGQAVASLLAQIG